VRKEQAKALTLLRNDEKYTQKVEKSRAQLAKIKEECKTLTAKTAENEKMLLKNHERAVTKGKRLKEIEEKIKENKEKMRKGNSNVVTVEMISEIEAEIIKLESEHKEAERVWGEKLANLEAECANRRLEEEKKLIILRDKEKEVKLNDIRLKEFKKLIIQSRAEKKDTEEHPKEFRSKRNIKYFERELS
jgi:multidrug resistance efflux pump